MPTYKANALTVTGFYYGMGIAMTLRVGTHAFDPPARTVNVGFATTTASDETSQGKTYRTLTPVCTEARDAPTLSIHAVFNEQIEFKTIGIEVKASQDRIEGHVEVDSPQGTLRITKQKMAPGFTASTMVAGRTGREHTLKFNVWFDLDTADANSNLTFRVIARGQHDEPYKLDQLVLKLAQ